MRLTLSRSDIDQNRLDKGGDKGLNLGILTNAGFRVPHGFCIATQQYFQFIKEAHMEELIGKLKGMDLQDQEKACKFWL